MATYSRGREAVDLLVTLCGDVHERQNRCPSRPWCPWPPHGAVAYPGTASGHDAAGGDLISWLVFRCERRGTPTRAAGACYVEGQNIALEIRYADWQAERLPVLAAELVALEVDVLVTYGPP